MLNSSPIKKYLKFIIIFFISIQIPLIISLSISWKMSAKLEAYRIKSKNIAQTAEVVRGPLSFLTDNIPFIEKVENITSIFSESEDSFKKAQEVTEHMKTTMYSSLLLLLLLIFLLFYFYRNSSIQDFGIALFFGGLLCIIIIALVHYFLIAHFKETFSYFYKQMEMGSQGYMIPFVPNMIRSFSKDFVNYIAHSLMIRNLIFALFGIPVGAFLIWKNK
jgi:hypothetical protein